MPKQKKTKQKNKPYFTGKGDKEFSLKPGIKFHLYISSAPCGDGRMFSLRENYQEDGYAKIDEHPEKESRGLLRYVKMI